MLVMSRKRGERIVIGEQFAVIEVVEIRGDRVRLGITADKEVPVHREEVYQAIKEKKEKCGNLLGGNEPH